MYLQIGHAVESCEEAHEGYTYDEHIFPDDESFSSNLFGGHGGHRAHAIGADIAIDTCAVQFRRVLVTAACCNNTMIQLAASVQMYNNNNYV